MVAASQRFCSAQCIPARDCEVALATARELLLSQEAAAQSLGSRRHRVQKLGAATEARGRHRLNPPGTTTKAITETLGTGFLRFADVLT